jgi:hypothetical protein
LSGCAERNFVTSGLDEVMAAFPFEQLSVHVAVIALCKWFPRESNPFP